MSEHGSPVPSEPPHLEHPRWSQRGIEWFCTGMGAWGVGTGFAGFVLLWTHGRPRPLTFAAGLLVAALIAYIAELLRDLIKEGVAIPAITGPRVIVTVLLLMIIELVVHAGTAIVQLGGDSHEAAATNSELQEILAPMAGENSGVMTEVIGMTIAWIVVGAVVARRLSRIVFLQLRGNRDGLLRGAREGVLGGLIAAPVCAVACQLLVRGFNLVSDVVLRGDDWAQEVRSSLGHLTLNSNWIIALKLPAYLWLGIYQVAKWGHGAGQVILAMAIALAGIWVWHRRASLWIRLGAVSAVLILLAPLPTESDRLVHIALLAMVIWVVPGFMLGVAAPLLRGAGDEPRLWGLIAFVAAALLCLLTWLKFANPWCYALAFGLVLIGLLFFRGAPLRDYWPLAAAAMASMVSGVMVIVEKATFLGVVSEAHEIYRQPMVRPDPLLAGMKALVDSLQTENIFDQKDLRQLANHVRELASLPADRQVEHLQEIKEMIAQIQLWARGAEAGYWREIAGGSMWGMFSPGDDVAELYRSLAGLTEHPPTGNHREAAYSRLLSQTDELIRDYQETAAKGWRQRAQLTNDAAEIEAALRSGATVSEDTARFGPALGSLVADLYQFSTVPPEKRGRQGLGLTSRIRIMMHDINMGVPGDQDDSMEYFHLPSLEPVPLEDRLTELWQQLTRELESPGTGGFTAPKAFEGDPAKLPWHSSVESERPVKTDTYQLKTRLDWLHMARSAIEHQRATLAREQEPAAPSPVADPPHHQETAAENTPVINATEKSEASHKPAKQLHHETNYAMAASFPSAARLARLDEIRQQLTEVQSSAEDLKRWWGAAPAVTLELSLVGSFGFWVTVALLASWSLTEPRKLGEGHG